ncbi:MAG: hypothetical protein ACJ8B6_05225, partial [Gemmatimonadales bacterium]
TVSGGLVVNATLASGVTAALGDWKAQITQGASVEQAAFTDTDGDGTFSASFSFLFPGTYSVTLVPPTGTFTSTPALPADQNVSEGDNATLNVTVDSYTPYAGSFCRLLIARSERKLAPRNAPRGDYLPAP